MSSQTKYLLDLFGQEIKVINIGVPSFPEDLKKQGVKVQPTDWRPPAGGNEKIVALLSKIRVAARKP